MTGNRAYIPLKRVFLTKLIVFSTKLIVKILFQCPFQHSYHLKSNRSSTFASVTKLLKTIT